MQQLKKIVEQSLANAKRRGASAAEIDVGSHDGFSVNVRCGKIDTIEYHQGKEFAITVYLGQKKATTITNDLSMEAIDTTIEKALNIAKNIDADPDAGLPEADSLAYDYPNLHLYHPWSIDIKDAIELAKECEKQGFAFDKRITNSEGANISTTESWRICANTLGFFGAYPASYHSLSCILIAGEGNDMQRDYSYTNARDAKDLEKSECIAHEAAKRAVKRLGAKTLTKQICPVIFAADIAKGLIANFLSAINGYNLYRQASFLLGSLGEKIFPEHICIDERPHLPKGLGSAPFDGEGVRTQARQIVKNGILQNYVLDSYTGRKLHMPTTGNAGGVHNLFINTSEKDLDGLLKMMDTGIFVTELMGQDANIVTGDYSQAAFGYRVENGSLQYPVEGFTIAANLRDMFLDLIAVGNDVDHRSNIHTGSILIAKMTIAGD